MAGTDDEKVLNWRTEWEMDVAGAMKKCPGCRTAGSLPFSPTKCDVVQKAKVWK